MESRKLKNILIYLDKQTDEKLIPEFRVVRQITDLQLLKYKIHNKLVYNEEVEFAIDVCIAGFIWFYEEGVTHDKLPDFFMSDETAKEFYEKFTKAWDIVQEFMQNNMSLLDE